MDDNRTFAFDDNRAGQSNQHPPFDMTQAPPAAVQRFFSTPELVHLVLSYLSKDRIDLLALSLVSKALRAQALRMWVKQLHVAVHAALSRLNFFKANPNLLEHVLHLRLGHFHDNWRGIRPPSDDKVCGCDWNALNELLRLIACESTVAGNTPLIDLRVYASDPLNLPDILGQQVVALNIQNALDHKYDEEIISLLEGSSYSAGHGDQEVSVQNLPLRPTSQKLARIFQQTRQGPGLRSFEFFFRLSSGVPDLTLQQILQHVVQNAPTLRYLRINIGESDFPEMLSTAAFVHLKQLHVTWFGMVQLPTIETLLDGAKNLQSLVLRSKSGAILSLRQTFPRLRDISISGLRVHTDDAESFAARHPNVIRLDATGLMPSDAVTGPASSSLAPVPAIYPNLAHTYIRHPDELQHHHDAGRFFAGLKVYSLDAADLGHCLELLHSNTTAAERLTTLGLEADFEITPSFFTQLLLMFSSQDLPNLAELRMSHYDDWQQLFGADCSLETSISRFMAALISARSLKVLELYGWQQHTQHKEILRDGEFPPALEYFCMGHTPKRNFRFISSHPDGRIVTTESGGKRGRLQRVPGAFRKHVTEDGVWHFVGQAVDTTLYLTT
ncbi:hypothetical protein OC846_001538 [Tilletia horrida]|uniref:Uncharacterized protein n=1 Tax=Tilletia horrida TaxID=155126 RepID=A0AAN6GTV3_9BASI|nr:hypothetical protein OC846_001538 [Tilletia horrida]KAK0568874.1 hypothetical protein OC861_001481 [Tilletia horrida]